MGFFTKLRLELDSFIWIVCLVFTVCSSIGLLIAFAIAWYKDTHMKD